MSKKLNLYTIKNVREIKCLGGIVGPINTPCELTEKQVLELVREGFTVFQHNPYNRKEKVKVTTSNFNNITFKGTRSSNISRQKLNTEMQSELKKSEQKDTEKKNVVVPENQDFVNEKFIKGVE